MKKKFRAYSRKFDKMIYPNDPIYKMDISGDGFTTIWKESIDDEGVPLMICMNIKDKNGKSVWEGDIIKITPIFDSNLMTQIFVVNDFISKITAFEYEIEILGNIYENPDLFE